MKGIQDRISSVIPNGHPEKRAPGYTSFYIETLEGGALIFRHRPYSSQSGHRLIWPRGRLSSPWGGANQIEDVEYVLEKLPRAAEKLRQLSP
ncbi:MAG: hypothetical protein SV375_14850, partial [Thermodesulfobacteriota bacterium]|nr:hypothetical protein [Thermodesulfobacteriota bacterium]